MIIELQRFLLTAKEGSITKAAKKIFITQSALTQSIQRLEKALGTKLFVQKGKYLELTEEGKTIEIIGNKIVALWEDAKNPQLRIKQPSYSIGMFDNAALRLGKYVQKFMQTNQAQLDLTIDNSGKLLAQLNVNALDVAVCVISHKDIQPKNISLVQTFFEELLPVSSKAYTGNLKEIPFILYNKGSHTREQTDAIFAKKNMQPTIFAESTSTTFMKELALLGSGVALLPLNAVRSELAQGTLKKQRLGLQWKRTYGVYINNTGVLTKDDPMIKALVNELLSTG